MNPAVFFRSRSQSRHKTFTMRGQPSTPRNTTAQFAVSPTAAALASMAQSDRDPCDLDTLIQRFGKHLLQPKRKNSNRKFVPDDLARAMDAHLQSTGLCPEGRVEKEPCQQFVQMIHRPAHDLQWSFADPLFWNTKKPRTTTVYTERSAEEYRTANWIELQGDFLTRNTSFKPPIREWRWQGGGVVCEGNAAAEAEALEPVVPPVGFEDDSEDDEPQEVLEMGPMPSFSAQVTCCLQCVGCNVWGCIVLLLCHCLIWLQCVGSHSVHCRRLPIGRPPWPPSQCTRDTPQSVTGR